MQRSAPQLRLFPDDAPVRPAKPGEQPGFSVRESARARRLSIKVYPRGRVEVVVPRRTRPRDVERFVSENRDWIRRAREELCGGEPEAFALPDRVDLPALGRSIRIVYEHSAGKRNVHWRESRGTVRLSGPVGDENACVAALKRWLAAVARREFTPRLAALSAETGIRYRRVQIRAQRTCWGSRSCSGTVSLNLCLLFVRPELLRYLMRHELCHGTHMSPPRRFWALVGRYEPDYRRLDRELGESWRAVPAWLGLV